MAAAAACNQMDAAAIDTAASRTFALPELLEHILVFLGQQERDAPNENPHMGLWPSHTLPRFEPPKTLFVLQRVSSTFRAIIARSKKLQSLMMVTQDSDLLAGDEASVCANLNPTWWLFHESVQSEGWWTAGDAKIFQLSCCIGGVSSTENWRDCLFRFHHNENTAADSRPSWRNIKLACSLSAGMPSELEFRIDRDVGPQLVRVSLDPDCTLGNLYDFFGRVTIYEEDDMLRLLHLDCIHDLGSANVESLLANGPLDADEDLLRYRDLCKKEVKAHPVDWQAEKWVDHCGKELKHCPYCTLYFEEKARRRAEQQELDDAEQQKRDNSEQPEHDDREEDTLVD